MDGGSSSRVIPPPPPGVRPYGDWAVVTRRGIAEPNAFGAHFNAELGLIRSMLRSYGLDDDYITAQAVRSASYDRHETLAEWQRRTAPPPGPKRVALLFTAEELERLAEHFEGANDPVAASIYAKARQAFSSSSSSDSSSSSSSSSS